MTSHERASFLRHMRTPALAFALLLILLAGMVAMGATHPAHIAPIAEGLILAAMILTILLLSMEVPREPGITRVFAGLGFIWVSIMFAMTLLDYLAR